jgi:hypothetical protein
MSGRRPPLEYRDVIQGLRAMGFAIRPGKATSHEQWVKTTAGRMQMAKQAGVSVGDFYRMCGKGW